MIADFSKIFKSNTNKSASSSRNTSISSIITNINPGEENNHNITNSTPRAKSTKKGGCMPCLFSAKTKFSSDKYQTKESLLGPQASQDKNKKTLVLDLDETLVHSSFQPFIGMDHNFEIDFGGKSLCVYISVRPGAEEFIEKMSKFYEIVVFTASQPIYAISVINLIDKNKRVRYSLFREHCDHVEGIYVKNLSKLGRDLTNIIIVDNSPRAFSLHPENAYQCANYYFDKSDTELFQVLPLLEQLSKVKDVRPVSEKKQEYEKKYGAILAKPIEKPVAKSMNIPDFEEIDLEEYTLVSPPKMVEVRNTLKSKKSLSSRSVSGVTPTEGTTRSAFSCKSSFPSTLVRDSYESSEDNSISITKKPYKTSVFQEKTESDISEDEVQGKQMHRSIVVQHKEKARTKPRVIIN